MGCDKESGIGVAFVNRTTPRKILEPGLVWHVWHTVAPICPHDTCTVILIYSRNTQQAVHLRVAPFVIDDGTGT